MSAFVTDTHQSRPRAVGTCRWLECPECATATAASQSGTAPWPASTCAHCYCHAHVTSREPTANTAYHIQYTAVIFTSDGWFTIQENHSVQFDLVSNSIQFLPLLLCVTQCHCISIYSKVFKVQTYYKTLINHES